MVVTKAPRSLARDLYRRGLRFWVRLTVRNLNQIRIEKSQGIEIVVLPGVFNGVRLRTGVFLAEALDEIQITAGARVLDLGTGSGIGALFAARRGARVVATDINPVAVRCAEINALAQHLEHRIETCTGDLFAPVEHAAFDLILFNPPFYHGHPRDLADAAWRSPDVFERFLKELPEHLTQNGRALVVLSSDGDLGSALETAKHLKVVPIRRSDLVNEILTLYEIRATDC